MVCLFAHSSHSDCLLACRGCNTIWLGRFSAGVCDVNDRSQVFFPFVLYRTSRAACVSTHHAWPRVCTAVSASSRHRQQRALRRPASHSWCTFEAGRIPALLCF